VAGLLGTTSIGTSLFQPHTNRIWCPRRLHLLDALYTPLFTPPSAGSTASMTSQHPRIPLAKRAVILGFNWHAGMHFRDIASKLVVDHDQSGASKMIQRAKERAADPTDFDDVLACLEDKHAGSRDQRIPEELADSEALRACSQQDELHRQMPFPDIAKELGIFTGCPNIESVSHLQYHIFRVRQIHK